jgi:phage terminase small subunit
MKGRPNTPTHLRAIEGNRGKRSLDTLEPEVPVIDGDAPAYLEGAALEMWNTLLPLLVKHVGLTVLDRPKLEMYCASYGRYRLATMALTKDGVTTRRPTRCKRPQREPDQDAARIPPDAGGGAPDALPRRRDGLKPGGAREAQGPGARGPVR